MSSASAAARAAASLIALTLVTACAPATPAGDAPPDRTSAATDQPGAPQPPDQPDDDAGDEVTTDPGPGTDPTGTEETPGPGTAPDDGDDTSTGTGTGNDTGNDTSTDVDTGEGGDLTADPLDDPPDEADTDIPPSGGTTLQAPLRAAWVHLFDGSLTTRAGIAEVVAELDAAGADAVIAQVARRHDAYWDSGVIPRTGDPGVEADLDVLDVLITEADAVGMDVHAWIGVAPTTHHVYDTFPAPAGWVGATRGPSAPEADRWVTRTASGEWTDYLDPALPAVRDHIAGIAVELAERYDIAGVHLDYARYDGAESGYHPEVLARFAAETGREATPSAGDPEWSQWRRDQVTALVARVRAALDGHDVALSAAVITWGAPPSDDSDAAWALTRPGRDALQDWPSWVRDGLVDAVMPMNYFRAAEPEQAAWLTGWLAFQSRLSADHDALVVPGLAGYLNTPADALAQIHEATATGDGAVMYSYQQPTLDESRGIWSDLASSGWGVASD